MKQELQVLRFLLLPAEALVFFGRELGVVYVEFGGGTGWDGRTDGLGEFRLDAEPSGLDPENPVVLCPLKELSASHVIALTGVIRLYV